MCRASSAGDDGFQPARFRGLGVLIEPVGRPMRGHDPDFVGDLEVVEHIGRMFQGGPVGLASHDDTDEGGRCSGGHSGARLRVFEAGKTKRRIIGARNAEGSAFASR